MTMHHYNHARPSRIERELVEPNPAPEPPDTLWECARCEAVNGAVNTICWKCCDPFE